MKSFLGSAHGGRSSTSPDSSEVMLAPAYVRGACEALRALGHDPAVFLARTSLDASRLYVAGEWLSLELVDAVLVEAVAMTGDPAFGLHWGERSPMTQFDLGPSLVANAPTLGEALDGIVRLQFLFANRAQCSLVQEGSRSTITLDLLAVSEIGRFVITELSLVSLLRGFQFLGQAPAIRRINVGYARPQHGPEYQRVFGSKLRFDQPRTTIEFASAALAQREGAYNEPLHRMLREHTDELSRQAVSQLRVAAQLEGHIRTALPRTLRAADAARLVGMSTRSLRRRLREEQVSYSDLVNQVQRDRAMQLLAQKSFSVKEVSSELGFKSTSGFQRAFRRWMGESPGRSRDLPRS